MYADLEREMGVSLCASRKIDDVTLDDVISIGKDCGIGSDQVILTQITDLCRALPTAMEAAKQELINSGYTHDDGICLRIEEDVLRRIDQIS